MAYGTIKLPEGMVLSGSLSAQTFALALADNNKTLRVYPVVPADLPSALRSYLFEVFNKVVADGQTYPQEEQLDDNAFQSYWLSYALFIGIVCNTELTLSNDATIEDARNNREWSECVGGFYYIKPNYPGRSSHATGFIVPNSHRGLKIGLALGRSYLHYGPRLGYRASVFNLVYVNNLASLAIWKRLGFEQVGTIPQAGRLKTADGGEEYFDAAVIYKRFDDVVAE